MKTVTRVSDRILAILLIALLMLGMIPMSHFTVKAADTVSVYQIKVVDNEGTPIEAALITYSIGVNGEKTEAENVMTDKNGLAVLSALSDKDVSTAQYKLYASISKTGYDAAELKGRVIKANSPTIKVALAPKKKVSVAFEVLTDDEYDEPISGAEILISGYSNDTGVTGNGTFTFSLYKGMEYQYKITKQGYHVTEADNVSFDSDTTVSIRLQPKKHDDTFRFENQDTVKVVYGETVINTASSSYDRPHEEILYSVVSGGEEIISVNQNTGEVTPLKAGKATVCATLPESEEYCEEKAYYTVKVLQAQTAIRFETDGPIHITYTPNGKYQNVISSTNNKVNYAIIEGQDAAKINKSNGELTIKKSGTLTVQAVRLADSQYAQASAQYQLIIDKAEQQPLVFDDPTPKDVKKLDKTFTNSVSGGSGQGTVRYSVIDGTECAEFKDENSPVLTLKKTGFVRVLATKEADDCYQVAQAEYVLTIVKSDNANFSFSTTNPVIIYSPNLKYTNDLSKGSGSTDITYSIVSGEEYASIDAQSGELTIKKASNDQVIEVKAVCAADDNYNEKTAVYYLTVQKANQTDFGFYNGTEIEKTWAEGDNHYVNVASGIQSTGSVTYSIKNADALSDGTPCATIDATSGQVTMLGRGEVVVIAHKQGDENYNPAEAEYKLTIKRSAQNPFSFSMDVLKQLTYNTHDNIIPLFVEGGSGNGAVTYSLVSGDAVTVRNGENPIAEVYKAGTVEIKAVKEATDTYDEISTMISITIDKANQRIAFGDHETITVIYGQPFQNTAIEIADINLPDHRGYAANQPISYEIIEGKDIASVTSSGELVFNDDVIGQVRVKAVKPGDSCYNPAEDEYTIEVVYASIPEIPYTLSGEQKNNSGWYTGAVTITPAESYQISYSNKLKNNQWQDQIVVSEDGEHSETIYLKKGSEISRAIAIPTEKMRIDQSAPHHLEITYSESIIDLMFQMYLDTLSEEELEHFSFYVQPVTVYLSATDDISHINKFYYHYGANSGEISRDAMRFSKDGRTASAEFSIAPQYRGKVSFTAEDIAGNTTEKIGERVVVVDDIAPGVTVAYDNNDYENGTYYDKARTATISIAEANFFPEALQDLHTDADIPTEIKEHLTILVTRIDDDGKKHKQLNELDKPFTYDNESSTWQSTVSFQEDGAYTVTIDYMDFSGNAAPKYETSFTIDKTKPTVNITYKNMDVKNDRFYREARKAVLTVQEHNFRAADVVLNEFAVQDIEGQALTLVYDYASALKNEDNWITNGNTHTIELPFDEDAQYSFTITYADMAGNEQESPVSDTFVVEAAAPDHLTVTYSESTLETIMRDTLFGMYAVPVTVTISADDRIAGVQQFICSCDTQVNRNSESPVNGTVIDESEITYTENGRHASATVIIPAQFRGQVSFSATNRSGVTSETFHDEKVIIVDDIAPGITVSYDNNSALNSSYFKENRTATVRIEEANFFEEAFDKQLDLKEAGSLIDEHLIIKVRRVDKDGAVYDTQLTKEQVKFAQTEENIWEAKILFEQDGSYSWSIDYKDFSGNTAGSFNDSFVVDKILPKLSISYDNMDAANGNCYNNVRNAVLRIEEHNFRSSDVQFVSFEAVDVQDHTVNTAVDYQQIFISQQWRSDGDIHELTIPFYTDAAYRFSISYTDMAGNQCDAPVQDTFVVDTTQPDANSMNISYSVSAADIALETVTFGFYAAPVTVTLSATDETAGIDSFTYSYQQDATVSVSRKNIRFSDNGKKAEISFSINPQYRGKVSFSVTDRAGNTSIQYADKKTVVVDNKPPVVSVKYDNNAVQNSRFYHAARTATITINEANFFTDSFEKQKNLNTGTMLDQCLTIKVNKEYNDGSIDNKVLKNVELTTPFHKTSGDLWVATLLFDEDADYTWSIDYRDFSGNIAQRFTDSFTVDKTDPKIAVSYDNNNAKNQQFFKQNRTVTIRIEEHNFDPQKVVVKVTTQQQTGRVEDYTAYFANARNWTSAGNIHTAKATFSTEAYYTFDVSCTDQSGRVNQNVDYGNAAAPKVFTIDKTAPTQLDIRINNESVLSRNGVAFEKFYANAVKVLLSANCNISGPDNLTYQKLTSAGEYSENGRWLPYNKEIEVDPDEKFVIYFRAEDKAGNYTIVNSIGIVVDSHAPVGQKFAPNIDIIPSAANANGLHRSDVGVEINVVDPTYNGSVESSNGFYSGINKITYRIFTKDTNAVQNGVLFDLAEGSTTGGTRDNDGLYRLWKGRITVSASVFNSNNVIVEVTAVDNAGNSRVTTNENLKRPISIDITPPSISISYDNNDGDSTFATAQTDAFFSKPRTARISITERNFDSSKVVFKATDRNTGNSLDVVNNKWITVLGNGNGDSMVHTAEIRYAADGDYTFEIEYTDQADNKNTTVNYNNSLAPTQFTIDTTAPGIRVDYSNNDVRNNKYYNDVRNATVTITEHNFEESRISLTAVGNNANKTVQPKISTQWKNDGDRHTLNIQYEEDAYYTFDIEYRDKAGNRAADRPSSDFYVDKTAPFVSISTVVDESANNDEGKIGYSITATDTNFDEFKPVLQAVIRTEDGFVSQTLNDIGIVSDIDNGKTFVVDNLDADGIYRISCEVKDKAGNAYTDVELSKENGEKYLKDRSDSDSLLTFSVNRNGSTYELEQETQKLIDNYYIQDVTEDVVIVEVNADSLTQYKVKVNDEEIPDSQYTVEESIGEGGWHKYRYLIDKSLFEQEREYVVVVSSTDKATNNAFSDIKNAAVRFVVDRTPPTVVVTGIETDGRYQTDNQEVTLIAEDNGGELHMLKVSLVDDNNAEDQVLIDLSDDALKKAMEEGNGKIHFTIGEGLYQNVRIVCNDMADYYGSNNIVYDQTIRNVSVTTNAFLIFWANRPLRWTVIIASVALVAGIIVFIVIKKRRKHQ